MVKAALITGAAGGIGKAICQEFRSAGYYVVGLDHPSADPMTDCDATTKADLAVFCNDNDYRQRIIETVRSSITEVHLSVLINNAATQIIQSASALTIDDWHTTLNVNLVAPFLLVQAFLSDLTANSGSVINVASIHASLTKPGFTCYATSKAALVGLTQSLSVDLGGQVRVNALAPAAIATPMLTAGFQGMPDALQHLAQVHPIGRIGLPKEVAQAALFLASDQASLITGAVLPLDGGIRNRLHDPI